MGTIGVAVKTVFVVNVSKSFNDLKLGELDVE